MKKILLLVILAALGYAWYVHVQKESRIRDSDFVGRAHHLSGNLFLPLLPAPEGLDVDLANLRRDVRLAAEQGVLDATRIEAWARLCRAMDGVWDERARHTEYIEKTRASRIAALQDKDEERRRQFFILEAERRWEAYAGQHRPQVERMIQEVAQH